MDFSLPWLEREYENVDQLAQKELFSGISWRMLPSRN
jgi:hypothetical protein